MLFLTPPQNAADIRAFCAHFPEGIRVEYKSTFDENVRRALPKIVSSFANSLGGVVVIGVETQDGVPHGAIQGFMLPDEELPLTIENICLQNINPPVIPQVRIVPSDVAGRSFAVLEVEESWDAPHAIENSKKVYVRTGNAGNPYELADVGLIIELVRRRAEPDAKRQRLMSLARARATTVVDDTQIQVEASISPTYPRHSLCSREEAWDFIAQSPYRGAHYFRWETLRRVEDGVACYNDRDQEYGQVNIDGLLLIRRVMRHNRGEQQQPIEPVLLAGELLHPSFRLLHCAEAFYRRVGYRGMVTVEVVAKNVRLQRMLFLPVDLGFDDLNDFQCFEDIVSGRDVTDTEHLSGDLRGIIQGLMRQVCWSFWQAVDAFPARRLDQYVSRSLAI